MCVHAYCRVGTYRVCRAVYDKRKCVSATRLVRQKRENERKNVLF